MKTIIAAIIAIAIAAPAFAQYNQQQGGWNSRTDALGNTYYQGTGSNQGWSGSSRTDALGNTYSTYNGPNGQTRNCNSRTDALGNTYTNCN